MIDAIVPAVDAFVDAGGRKFKVFIDGIEACGGGRAGCTVDNWVTGAIRKGKNAGRTSCLGSGSWSHLGFPIPGRFGKASSGSLAREILPGHQLEDA